MTTFVLPSEVFPVSMRTAGHGIAAGIGKLGAFVGVFLVPVLQDHIARRGLLAVAGVSAVLGFAVTGLLPEPAGRTLEDVADQRSDVAVPAPVRVVVTDDVTSRELKTAKSEPAHSQWIGFGCPPKAGSGCHSAARPGQPIVQ
jgi:nitrate/nitrite transporter NarK